MEIDLGTEAETGLETGMETGLGAGLDNGLRTEVETDVEIGEALRNLGEKGKAMVIPIVTARVWGRVRCARR